MRLNHCLESGLLLHQLLGGFFVLLAKGLQLGDPSTDFFSMVAQLTDFLHSFIRILCQGTSQLYLIRQASHVVTTFNWQHHNINSFTGSA
jgi:hypothetical protein